MGALEVEGQTGEEKVVGGAEGVKRNRPRLFGALSVRSSSERVQGPRGSPSLLRPSTSANVRTFQTEKTLETSIYAMEQTAVLYAFVSFLVLLISSVS